MFEMTRAKIAVDALTCPSGPPEPVSIMGVDLVPFESYSQATECIEDRIASGQKSFWVAINPQKIYRAWHDPELMSVLARADVGICDGVGVSIAAEILYGKAMRRCTGCDLFFKLMHLAAQKGWGVFLLGASERSNELACKRLLETYPGLQIAGHQDGYFADTQEVIRQINGSSAKMLFVAMGTPRQEKWIAEHIHQINASFFLGVGGTFDVASGLSTRAPSIFQKTGTEFLYQLVSQPWRWKRQIVYTPFMIRVLAAKIFGSNSNRRRRQTKL